MFEIEIEEIEGLLQKVNEGDCPSLVHLLTNLKYDPYTKQNDKGETLLHLACRNGHFDIVRTLIEVYDFNVEYNLDKQNNSSLHAACASEQFKVVAYLCQQLHIKAESLQSAFLIACKAGCLPIVKLLFCIIFTRDRVKSSIYQDNIILFKVNANDLKRMVPINLHFASCLNSACSNGHLHIIKFLLEEVSLLFSLENIIHNNCKPLLMQTACERGYYEIFDYLFNLLYHINASNMTFQPFPTSSDLAADLAALLPYHEPILLLAVKHADMPLYDHLEKYTNLDVVNCTGNTLLHAACISCDLNMVKRVWSKEYIGKKNKQGSTCLHLACEWGSLDIIKFLIEKGFYINEKNYKNQTIFHLSIIYERVDIFMYLLNDHTDSIDVFAATGDGETPLHLAASNTKLVKLAEILVAQPNSDKMINAFDKYKETPIFNACRTGDMAMVSLLRSKSDLLATNIVGETIFHIACRLKMKEILSTFFNSCDHFLPKLTNCVGQTLLHIACRESLDMVKYLASQEKYDMSGDINLIDNTDGLTLLQYACKRWNVELFQYLLRIHDCDSDATNHKGETVFHICCKYNVTKLEKLCLEHCSISLKDSNGDTPLQVACKNGNHDMMLSILKNLTEMPTAVNTLLHLVAEYDGAHKVLKHLINEQICNYRAKNADGDTALHIACNKSHKNALYLFSLEYDDESWYRSNGNSPLYNKVYNIEYPDDLEYLRSIAHSLPSLEKCIAKVQNNDFPIAASTEVNMPFSHYLLFTIGQKNHLCSSGNCKNKCALLIDIIKSNSIINLKDSRGNNIMHYLALCSECRYLDELYDEVIKSDTICKNNIDSYSPLHFACLVGNESAIFKILQQEGSSKLLHEKNTQNKTPSDLISKGYQSGCVTYLMAHGADMEIQDPMAMQMIKEHKKNPSISIIVLGNSSVGKTSLVHTLKGMLARNRTLKPNDEDIPTTGMVTDEVLKHKTNDVYIFHDFAGHTEFEMSHQQWLESLFSSATKAEFSSPIVFLLLVKATDHLSNNKKQIDKWFSFVHRHVQITNKSVHTALVCTHEDEISGASQREERILGLEEYFNAKDAHPLNKHGSPFFLNGLNSDTTPLNSLLRYLDRMFVRTGDHWKMSRACIELDFYLEEWFPEIPFQVKSLIEKIAKQRQFNLNPHNLKIMVDCNHNLFLPNEPKRLVQLLTQLHAQNHITILQVADQLDWWIISKKMRNILSSELNSIFSPKGFKDAPGFTTDHNTGVVPTQKLSEIFEHLSLGIELIERYLVSMEYCKPIEDKDLLKLITGCEITDEGNQHFFFPGLIKKEKVLALASPSSSMHHYGWLFENPQDLGLRFLHLLLLSLTFKFASDDVESGSKYERRLVLWKTGIFCHTIEGVDILVEVENDRKVIALFRCVSTEEHQLKLAKIRFRVISEVESVLKRACNVTVKEGTQYILYPPPTDYDKYDTQQVIEVSKLVKKLTKEPDSRIVYITNTSTASLPEMLGFDSLGRLKKSVLDNLKSSDSTLSVQTFGEVESQIGCSNLAQIIGISISDHMRDEFVRMHGSESKSALSAQLSEYSVFKLEDLPF